jgi:hypothetical protein
MMPLNEDVCTLCRGRATQRKEYNRDERALVAVVSCPQCGEYRVKPQPWTGHERRCLAAYVRHEREAGRRTPVIAANNWQTLARIGATLLRHDA